MQKSEANASDFLSIMFASPLIYSLVFDLPLIIRMLLAKTIIITYPHNIENVDGTTSVKADQAQVLFRRIRVLNLDNGISITDEDLVFQRDYKGEYIPCNTRSFEPRLKRYCRECNMPELKSQHDIRRTVITNLYYKGVPLKEIQRIAGHSSLNMTMSYIKFQDNDNDADYMERLCANS